jgi:hypothetical protein
MAPPNLAARAARLAPLILNGRTEALLHKNRPESISYQNRYFYGLFAGCDLRRNPQASF